MRLFLARKWAQEQFGAVQLGDKRRTERAVKYAAAALSNPPASIPQQCVTWHDTKAAYRLFDCEEANFASLLEPHWSQTRRQAGGTVLLVQDTTTLSFNHPATAGLGPTTSGEVGLGLLLHSCLAVQLDPPEGPGPRVLGLAHSQIWARGERKSKLPESIKWSNAIHAVGQPLSPETSYVHVGDSESDCWEAMAAAQEQGVGFALRACQDRRVLAGHESEHDDGQVQGLFELLRRQKPLAQKWIYTRRRKEQESRCVQLHVSAVAVTVLAPKNWSSKPHRKGQDKPRPIRCWAVRVWEQFPPQGVEPIEWMVLTSKEVADGEDALEVAGWYSRRWLVEEYHKCLKSGCKVEERQLQEGDRLEALTAILSVVAVRLLQMKEQARQSPDTLAREIVPRDHLKALCGHRKLPQTMSIKRFWIEVARLGGFLARKSDGDPGWLTTWRGWQTLELLARGYALGQRGKRECG